MQSSANTPLTVAFAAIARPTFDVPLAQSVAEQAVSQLTAAGIAVVGVGAKLLMDGAAVEEFLSALTAVQFDCVVILQASFADSSMTVRVAQALQQRGAPLLLWAVPDERSGGRLRLNSLCGINLAGHALTLQEITYEYLLTRADDPGAAQRIGALSRAGRARRHLSGARVGLVGEHPVGFDTCRYDAADLDALFGVEVQAMPLHHILAQARTASDSERALFVERASQTTVNLGELDQQGVNGTAGVYVALANEARQRQLSGIAVRCWPEFFTELGCAACGAMSMLSEERCPASCEADVNGTITSLLLQELSGAQAFIADLVSIDNGSDTGVLWHCGLAPVSMADKASEVRGTIHSNRKLPLLFEFTLKPGRVTLARLHRARLDNGREGYQLLVGGGEMVAAPPSYSGTSGVIRFDKPATQVLDTIMRRGIEHHLCLTYGDFRPELRAFAQLINLPILELT
jgi:L-fucose isomerase-like protein